MFDSVSLKPNGWHVKLQRFVFGVIHFKNNFCPFFWMTILSLFVFPFVLAYKLLKLPFMALDRINILFYSPIYYRRVVKYASKLTDKDAFYLYKMICGSKAFYQDRNRLLTDISYFIEWHENNSKKTKALDRFNEWRKQVGPGWGERLVIAYNQISKEIEQKRFERLRLKELNSAANAKRKKFFATLVNYTHFLVWLTLGIVLIYATYYLGVLALLMYENWGGVFDAMIGLFIIAAFIGIVAVVFFLIKRFGGVVIGKPIVYIAKKIGKPVGSVFEFFAMYFKVMKENHCPSIEWEENA